MPRSFEDNLNLYAQLAVRAGVNVQPDQELLITADVADAPFVRLIVAEAYRAGAKSVLTLYSDDANTLARYELGSDGAMNYVPAWLYDGREQAMTANAARLVVFGSDPAAPQNIDPVKVAAYSQLPGQGKPKGCPGSLEGSPLIGASSARRLLPGRTWFFRTTPWMPP